MTLNQAVKHLTTTLLKLMLDFESVSAVPLYKPFKTGVMLLVSGSVPKRKRNQCREALTHIAGKWKSSYCFTTATDANM